MTIKIKENKITLVLGIILTVVILFIAAVVYFSFINVQNGWQTFVSLCNGIASGCQELLYGSVQTLVVQKKAVVGFLSFLFVLFILMIAWDFIKTKKFINKFKIEKQIGRFVIIKSDKLIAFTAGYIHPKIYLSQKLFENLDENELNAVLLHEKSHMRTFDNLKKLVLRAFASAFFFLPILKDIQKIISERHENQADSSVIHNMTNGREYLLSSMLKFESHLDVNESVSYFSVRSERLIGFKEAVYKINLSHLLISFVVMLITSFALFSQNVYAKNLIVTQCTQKTSVNSQVNESLSSEMISKANSCVSN